MENKVEHPNKDPLLLRGKIIGLSHDEKRRYAIKSFSHPSVTKEYDEKEDRHYMKVGYVVSYETTFNFKYSGRKVVSFKVKSLEVDGVSELQLSRLRKSVINFLENHSEEIIAKNIEDTILPWDEETRKDI